MIQALIPPLSLLISAIIFGTILHTKRQQHRIYLTPIFLLTAYYSLATPDQFSFCISLFSLWDLAVGLYVLHTLSLFHIEQWPAPTPPAGLSPLQSYQWKAAATYRLWGNPRMFIPNKDVKDRKQQTYRDFAILRIAKLGLYYLFLSHFAPTMNAWLIGDIQPSDVNAAQRN